MLHAQTDRGKDMFSSQNCLCVLVQDQPTSEMCTMTAAAVCGDAFVHLTSEYFLVHLCICLNRFDIPSIKHYIPMDEKVSSM